MLRAVNFFHLHLPAPYEESPLPFPPWTKTCQNEGLKAKAKLIYSLT